MNSMQSFNHKIGEEGNSVQVTHIKDDWYTFHVSDHYDESSVTLFLHKEDIHGLIEFLNFVNKHTEK